MLITLKNFKSSINQFIDIWQLEGWVTKVSLIMEAKTKKWKKEKKLKRGGGSNTLNIIMLTSNILIDR